MQRYAAQAVTNANIRKTQQRSEGPLRAQPGHCTFMLRALEAREKCGVRKKPNAAALRQGAAAWATWGLRTCAHRLRRRI